jgi:hypothetical protein
MSMPACPRCGHGASVGRIGRGVHFCADCCVEFSGAGPGLRVYAISSAGDLFPLEAGSGAASEDVAEVRHG